MAKGDVTEVGAPIDSARLWWFIKAHQVGVPFDTMRREGYNAALADLARWLRAAGY